MSQVTRGCLEPRCLGRGSTPRPQAAPPQGTVWNDPGEYGEDGGWGTGSGVDTGSGAEQGRGEQTQAPGVGTYPHRVREPSPRVLWTRALLEAAQQTPWAPAAHLREHGVEGLGTGNKGQRGLRALGSHYHPRLPHTHLLTMAAHTEGLGGPTLGVHTQQAAASPTKRAHPGAGMPTY